MPLTKNKDKQDGKNFGLMLSAISLILGIIFPLIKKESFKMNWIFIGLILLICSFIFPNRLFKLRKYWIKLGNFLGHINSTIIFSLAFFLVISPIAIFFRLIGRDVLKLKNGKYKSTWIIKNDISNFEDIY